MFKKYIAYESEDEKLGFFETEKDAEAWLKKEIFDFIECYGSIPDGCNNSFIAKIVSRVEIIDSPKDKRGLCLIDCEGEH